MLNQILKFKMSSFRTAVIFHQNFYHVFLRFAIHHIQITGDYHSTPAIVRKMSDKKCRTRFGFPIKKRVVTTGCARG